MHRNISKRLFSYEARIPFHMNMTTQKTESYYKLGFFPTLFTLFYIVKTNMNIRGEVLLFPEYRSNLTLFVFSERGVAARTAK
jgi:hypothetical protein